MTDIYKLKINTEELDPENTPGYCYPSDFNPDVYSISKSWNDAADAVFTSNDLIFSNIRSELVYEVMRQVLDLPYYSDDHGYNHDMSFAGYLTEIKSDEAISEHPKNNYMEDIYNQLAQQEEDNNTYNSENVTENVWILQSTIEGDTLYVTAFKISGKPINILKHWSDRMASDIKSARKKEQQQKADAKYTELKSEIMKLSKEKKADLIKTLIK